MALSSLLVTLAILRASVLAEAAKCEFKNIPGSDGLEAYCSLEDFHQLTISILRSADIQSL